MTKTLSIIPFLLPFITGIFGLVLKRPCQLRRVIFIFSNLLLIAITTFLCNQCYQGKIFTMDVGGWDYSLGISIAIDLLAALMTWITALVAAAATIYSFREKNLSEEHPLKLPLMQFLIAGVNLAFTTADLFNLFVAYEILLVAGYALLTLETKDFALSKSFSYIITNLFGSTIFLITAGITYCIYGTLNFAQLSILLANSESTTSLTILASMLLFVFGIKSAMFPLYSWLPVSYPIMPFSSIALFTGIMTKVGVYNIFRFCATILPETLSGIYIALMILSALTMLLGVLGALSRNSISGILAYHSISQIGFMLLAIGYLTPLSLTAAILYMIHHSLVKPSLILLGGEASHICKSSQLKDMGHVFETFPWMSSLFFIQALSLSGLPPLSGFWAKYMIVFEGILASYPLLVAATLLTGLFTLLSMLKIWNKAFWSDHKDWVVTPSLYRRYAVAATMIFLVIPSLTIAFRPESWIQICQKASEQALDRTHYQQAVTSIGRHL